MQNIFFNNMGEFYSEINKTLCSIYVKLFRIVYQRLSNFPINYLFFLVKSVARQIAQRILNYILWLLADLGV